MNIKLNCIVNSTHRILYDEYFAPSIPNDIDIIKHESDIITSGTYMTDGYINILKEKAKLIAKSFKDASKNDIIVWSDIDVIVNPKLKSVFRKNIIDAYRITKKSLLYQRELHQGFRNKANYVINGGFFISRSDSFSINLYETVAGLIEDDPTRHDQDFINDLIKYNRPYRHKIGVLPYTYASASNYGRVVDPNVCLLYHANCTHTLPEKLDLLNKIRDQLT